jgi:hypothetical protein
MVNRPINIGNVTKMTVYFSASGSITYINDRICPTGGTFSVPPEPTCLPDYYKNECCVNSDCTTKYPNATAVCNTDPAIGGVCYCGAAPCGCQLPPPWTVVQAPVPAPVPVRSPTKAPTKRPTRAPTKSPTKRPTRAPTKVPTKAPTKAPVPALVPVPAPVPALCPTTNFTSQCVTNSPDITKQCGYIYPGAVGPTCGANGVCQCGGAACGCVFTPPTACPAYDLGFENAVKGDYVRNKWAQSHGVIITAKKDADCGTTVGYTPWGAARVFDTASPGTNNDNGDPDLGSPNQGCNPSGPGIGNGGNPLNSTNPNAWNCDPQGKSLVIQEYNNQYPDDAWCGGTITFDFYHSPAFIGEVGLLDVDGSESVRITVSGMYLCENVACFPVIRLIRVLVCFTVSFTGNKAWRHVQCNYCSRIWRQLDGEATNQYWKCDQDECVLQWFGFNHVH